MTNQMIAAGCGAAVYVCNSLVEAGWLSWWTGVPIVMALAFIGALVLTRRRRNVR